MIRAISEDYLKEVNQKKIDFPIPEMTEKPQ